MKYINIANILTLSRILLGFVFLFLFMAMTKIDSSKLSFILMLQIISFFVVIVASITDGLDGYFARKNNQVSDFGKHFDPLADSFFFIIVFISFAYIGMMPWYFLLAVILRESFMHFFLRPFFKYHNSSLPANIYGKVKTVLQILFVLLLTLGLIIFQSLNILYTKQGIFRNCNFPKFQVDYIKNFNIIGYIFFALIAFLSLFSLGIYLVQFGKFLRAKKD